MIRTVQLHDLAALCTRVARWEEGVRALVMAICCALHTFRVRLPPLATNGLIGINSIISGMRARGRREHRERDEEASDASARPSRHNARGRASGFSPCAGRGNLLESQVERAMVGRLMGDGKR